MRVHHDTLLHVERVSQNNIGGLARNAAKREQLLHVARHFTMKLFAHCEHAFMHGFGFVAPEVQRLHIGFNLRGRCVCKISRRWKRGEQSGSGFIHANIGALRAQNCGDEQLMRLGPIQCAVRGWIARLQRFEQSRGSCHLRRGFLGRLWNIHGGSMFNGVRF